MYELLSRPEFIWLGIAIILFIVEAITINLFTIWFAIGALGAMVTALLGGNLVVQIIVFLVISIILLIFTRPFVKKFVNKTPTNADRVVGRRIMVIQTIDNLKATGQVKIDGNVWTARSVDDSVIPTGETVEVLQISGVKLIVKKA